MTDTPPWHPKWHPSPVWAVMVWWHGGHDNTDPVCVWWGGLEHTRGHGGITYLPTSSSKRYFKMARLATPSPSRCDPHLSIQERILEAGAPLSVSFLSLFPALPTQGLCARDGCLSSISGSSVCQAGLALITFVSHFSSS
jgi:hypothetical protein